MKTEEYRIFDKTLVTRPGIYKKVNNLFHPVLYFQKALGATEEDYEKIVEHLILKK